MDSKGTRPERHNRPDLSIVADPFANADAEWWRTACLLAWSRALDLHDECERLRGRVAYLHAGIAGRTCSTCRAYACETHDPERGGL